MDRRARGRVATLLLPIAALILCFVASGLTSPPAGGVGIVPPANPPANIAPSSGDWVQAINSARAQEGVGPLGVSESQLSGMSVPQQVFTVVNAERVDRGLPPINDMTSQLDAYAQAGANAGTDPSFPSALSGGAPLTWGGAVWAGGLSSVLEADYFWMYDDGWGGSGTTNAACSPSTPSECWGHRDIILHPFPNCPGGAPVLSMGAAISPSGYPGGSIAAILVSSCAPPSDITMSWGQVASDVVSTSRTIGIAPTSNGAGYWEVEGNGTVANFGAAQNFGSVNVGLNAPIVGIAPTSDNGGYWLVASDGGIFSFGDATFHGSMGGSWINSPIVGIAADSTTGGYWEVGADGGIFSFDAPFYGSTGSLRLNQPIVGIEAANEGGGYRFVAADGGIFTFGNAPFDGSTGGLPLVAPVVAMAPDNATNGYWLAAQDGGIFTFGGAAYLGRVVS